MYFDRRLWQLTRGLRGRIALAAAVGIARFVLFGVMLAAVFRGLGFVAVALPACGVAAAVIARGWLEHRRAIFAFLAWWDVPVAAVMLVAALVTLAAPVAFHRLEARRSHARHQALKAFGAEFLDGVQGLPTLKAFGQSAAYGRRLADRARVLSDNTLAVLATSVMTRGITDCGVAIGAALAL